MSKSGSLLLHPAAVRSRCAGFLTAVLIGLLSGAGCARESGTVAVESPTPPPSTSAGQAPDLVLLLVGGLRADAPGEPSAEGAFLAGMPVPPTVRYRAAYTPSLSSYVCLGSILTGRYPSAIPLCGPYVKASGAAPPAAWCAELPADRRTVADLVALYGYRTALVSAGRPDLEPLADRFQRWIDVADSGGGREALWAALRDAALGWWREEAVGPRLLVVVGEDLVSSEVPRMRRELGFPGDGWPALQLLTAPLGSPPPVGEEQRGTARRMYEQAAEQMGVGCGTIVAALRAPAGENAPWIAVASTHGLNLLEDGGFERGGVYPLDHGLLLDRTARVPLVVFDPRDGAQVREIDEPVELLDLHGSLLGLAGVERAADLDAGADLLRPGPAATGEPMAYVEFGDMFAVREGRHLLVFRALLHDANALDPELDRRLLDEDLLRDPGAFGLFDVVADPAQQHNLCATDLQRARTLRQRMIDTRTSRGAVPTGALTPERLWEIRMSPSEGYW
jgi:arylsulfatase A-like enzyme